MDRCTHENTRIGTAYEMCLGCWAIRSTNGRMTWHLCAGCRYFAESDVVPAHQGPGLWGPLEWFRCDRCGLEIVGRERDGVVHAKLDADVPPSRPETPRVGRCPACCDGSERDV